MTFNEYKEELIKKAEEKNIDYTEIIKKYENRYNLGLEAGLTEDEIVNRFESVDEVLKTLENEKNSNLKNFYLNFDSGDVTIKVVEGDSITYVYDKKFEEYYDVKEVDNKFSITYKKSKFLYHKNIELQVLVGEDVEFNEFRINLVSGDLVTKGKISAKEIKIDTVSGDASIDQFDSQDLAVISSVNGDISINNLKSTKGKISTVSGDITIKKALLNELGIGTVSGDVVIDGTVLSIKSSSVSGDVVYNGYITNDNFTNKFKNVFRRKNNE